MIKDVGVYSNNNKGNIRLNGNESPIGISEDKALDLLYSLKNIELNRYPDSDGDALREAYSKYVEVKKENIIIGNGSDEMINLVISKNISKGDKLLTVNPDFSMYDFYTNLNEGEVIKYKYEIDDGFNIDEFIRLGIERDVKLIIFSNPNNPTGYGFKIEDIKKILESFKEKIVLVDEAYCEFYGESIVPYINEYKNLIVTRTLSKAFGLAALRVGFLIANKESIEELMKYKTPYNVNSISQEIAVNVLRDRSNLNNNLDIILSERGRMYKELKKIEDKISSLGSDINFKVYPSKANFFYGVTSMKDELIEALKDEKIIIRNFNDDNFRISIGLQEENEKVIKVIENLFLE